ncbi:hypothetical protein ACFQ9X_23540 [Catenulispora yoronensis]
MTAADQAVAWFADAELGAVGAVVRPADGAGAGTDRARFCADAAQVHAAVSALLGTGGPGGSANVSATVFGGAHHSVLVQERLAGAEFVVDTVSIDGVHLVADTWRRVKEVRDLAATGTPISDFEEPADPAAPEVAAIHSYVLRALDALGVRHGAAHSRVVLTARGPVLVDPGAGLGDDTLPWVAEKFLGYSTVGLLAAGILQPRDTLQRAARLPERWPEPIRRVALINRRPGPVRPSPQWAARWRRCRPRSRCRRRPAPGWSCR